MKVNPLFVFDTNALVSAHLVEGSVSDRAYKHALQLGFIAISDELMVEFIDVVCRGKFDKYFKTVQARFDLSEKIEANAVSFTTEEKITVCVDPDDNMILELAVTAHVSCIISGDPHLRSLNPFRDIPILSPADFLKAF